MSEQGFSAEENSPAATGPDMGDTGAAEQNSQEVDWQKRYVDTQEAYTRGQQELAEHRERQQLYERLLTTDDSEVQRQIALELGYELPEAEETQEFDPEEDDPFVQVDERLSRVEQANAQREEAQHQADMQRVVGERLSALQVPEATQNWVLAYAVHALPATREGLPDLDGALKAYQEHEAEQQRAWARTKQAPHISPHGQSATEVPNLDNRQDRQDFIVRRMQEGEQAGY